MKHELAPGMLCVIIGDPNHKENVGVTVTTVKFVPANTKYYPTSDSSEWWDDTEDSWWVETVSSPLLCPHIMYEWEEGGVYKVETIEVYEALIAAKYLLPIPPKDVKQSTKHEEEQPA